MKPLCLLLLLALPAAAQEGIPDVVARAAGRDLTREEFAHWLLERWGREHVKDFAVETLALSRAAEQGLLPDAAQVAAAYDAELAAIVDNGYRGDLAAFERELAGYGKSLADRRAGRLPLLRVELAMQGLARRARVVDDAAIERRYHEVYGSGGESTRLQVLFFSAWAGGGEQAADTGTRRAAAVARAEDARTRLAAGEDFAALLAASDPPGSDFVREGVVRAWRRDLLGPEVERAVEQLDRPGDLAPVVAVWDGAWVVRLESRRPVSLAEVREELAAELRAAPVDTGESMQVYTELEREVELLLN